ncbi:MAG: helix-turn-helix transcriptional regulator [Lentisphaeria bacterium]|nr:helix-turn-helix transcriptional regulator [Lentisphaeria bacterium]
MPDVKSVLQEEIRRLARKEVKLANAPLIKMIGELKRKVASLERLLAAAEKKSSVPVAADTVCKEEGKADVKCDAEAGQKEKKPRFYGKKIIRLRKRLHLSQAELAEMVGVNMFSVSHWELGKNVPRQAQQEKLAEIRALPRKELRERLAVVRIALQEKKAK